MRIPGGLGLVCVASLVAGIAGASSFTTFESGQVRPLALSPDVARLYAVNTPDNRLEIFDVTDDGLTHVGAVPVGLEPVAVAARSNGEVWVVNHLSDDVSIVDVGVTPARVVRTLLVGDEPRDVVFAGPGGNRAFITAAHRGQNRPGDPQLTTPGVGRADVWVFDAASLDTTLGGTPLTIVTLFGDTPRALATNGTTVWAAVFESGNQTTTLNEGVVCNGGATAPACNGGLYPGGLPAPNKNVENVTGPETGLVVKFDNGSGQWRDRLGRNWSNGVKFSLPDLDVFAINANANPPTQTASFAHVGTVLFNMAVNPVSGKVYVSNTEARNDVRFEGPGILSGGETVRGHLAESRITILSGATVTPRHLNKHIDYATVPSSLATNDASLATPTGIAVSSDGTRLYVAAFGSSKIGVFSTSALENDTFTPSPASHWPVSGGGPSGLVLDEARGRLYVLTRFDDSISILDTASGMETDHLPLYNPEPQKVVQGRPFLYDARFTSSNGEAACASCHIFGDFDSLAWDLGNPDDVVLTNLNPFRVADPLGISFPNHHPIKGPMTTQSLRGMAGAGPMHWRGDRSGANDPGGSALDEDAAFKRFNVAFAGLLGRSAPLTGPEMQAFTDFILEVSYPPNPIRALDNSLTIDQQAGHDKFHQSQPVDVFQTCNGCHVDDPSQGHFGTDGFSSFEFETQLLKIPHLRNLYQKIGMFGLPAVPFVNSGDNGSKGAQVRGFGFLHDGSIDTIFRFHQATVFNQTNPGGFPISNPGGFPSGASGDTQRRQVEQFMLAFNSRLAPIVGQQVTLDASSGGDSQARVSLLLARATAGECDVVVKGVSGGEARGWVFAGGVFQSDRLTQTSSDADLRGQAAAGEARTYTCVPPGEGVRIGIDRDEDGAYDGDEIAAGTDPADPSSNPASSNALRVVGTKLQVKNALPDDETRRKIVVVSKDPAITPAAPGGPGDPRCGGDPFGTEKAELVIVSPTTGHSQTSKLPCQNWTLLGSIASPKGYKYKDPELDDGTAKSVTWKARRLKATLSGKGPTTLGYDLQFGVDEAAVATRFSSGAVIICLECAAFNGKNGSDGKQFLGKTPTCPAPATCAAAPGSPSGAFLEID
jgi:DNA-binding beta-propeller fold protein YncE